jgi:hypothetical protein
MEEGRKRVLGIIAGILVARHLKTTEDLFDTRDSAHTFDGSGCGAIGGADSQESCSNDEANQAGCADFDVFWRARRSRACAGSR